MSYSRRPYLLTLACAAALLGACAESPENADPEARNEQPRADGGGSDDDDTGGDDDGASDDEDDGTPPPKDAGVKRDGSTSTSKPDSGGTTTPRDAGSSSGGSSNPLDDLLGGIIDIFNPPKDAGTDAGKRDGG
jgi:hypothetical protein